MQSLGRTYAAAILFLVGAVAGGALDATVAAEPRRVLLLHSFGPHFAPWNAVAASFREEITKTSPAAIDLYEASLDSARFAQPHDPQPLVDYLRALFASQDPNLVVTMGAPAARFAQRYRSQLFPSAPLLIAGADVRTVDEAALTANDTAVTTALDLPRLIENVLHVLPDTTNIAIVIGASPHERYWVEELRRASQPFASRVTFEWFNELPLEEMLKRAAARPPHSAIFYASVRVDARGVPHEEDRVLARLREAANAPIFGYIDINFGHGLVGGPHLSTAEIGQKAASVAARILGGESPGSIKTPPFGLGTPEYDWRELQRWNIGEDRLPPGSTIHFRAPTLWHLYRWPLLALFALLVFQASMITWLLFERRSRRFAELESRRRLLEVVHLNRTAEAGALSASFAHELRQPLAAIMMNVDTAESMLRAKPLEVGKLEEVLADIRQADQHAADITGHFGALLKHRREVDAQVFDLAGAITDALNTVSPEAKKRSIALCANRIHRPLPVLADRVHIQQVILNLANNAMDAMSSTAADARTITIETTMPEETVVEVSVSDSGPGIPDHQLGKIFETFYTTKEHGTGLGLSIARTIVEMYGGKIWAENCPGGGAAFRFTLPLSTAPAGHSNCSGAKPAQS